MTDEVSQKQGVAIIFDGDNFLHAVRDDSLIFSSRKRLAVIGRIIAEELIKIAQSYGEVIHRFGAMAPAPAPWNDTAALEAHLPFWHQTADLHCAMVDAGGFRISAVPSGLNASDNELERMITREILRDGRVKIVVLVTGDGKPPFPTLIDALNEKGKKVHMVVYNKQPHVIERRLVDYETCTRLMPLIHEQLEQLDERPHAWIEDSREKSPVFWYRKAIRAFQRREESDFKGDTIYLERAKAALEILSGEEARTYIKDFKPGKVAQFLKERMPMPIEHAEALELVYGFIKADIFKPETMYSLSPEFLICSKIFSGDSAS